MFIELLKEYLGYPPGKQLDVPDEQAKGLVSAGVAKPIDDPTERIVARAMGEAIGRLTQSMDAALTSALKQFADAAGKSQKYQVPALFGDGGRGDPKKTFGHFLYAVATQDHKALEEMGSQYVSWTGGAGQKAALTSQAGAQGGYTVPIAFLPELLTISAENAIVEPRALKVPMASQVVEIPALDHTTAPTAGETAFFGGVQANWAEEAAALSEEEPAFKQARLVAHELSGYSYVSNTLLQDSAIGLEALLKNLFGRAIGWYKDYGFLRGNGAGKPLGVLNWTGFIAVSRSAASAFALADAAGMLARLLPPDAGRGVCWVCHPTVLAKLYTMVSSAVGGGTVYLDNARDLPRLMLLGYPVCVTEKVPALNTQGDIMLCDFGRYLIGERQEVEVAFSPHYRFTNNQGTWRFVCRVDGRPWMNDKVTLSDGSNSLSPFVGLAAG